MLNQCFNIEDLRLLAQKKVPKAIFDYADGGSDDEKALKNNSSSFDKYQLIPNVLCDVRDIDIKTHVLGCDIDMPFYISPVGQARFFHPDSDLAGARAADKFNTLFSLSTFAGQTLEDVAHSTNGNKMYQVYVMTDKAQNKRLIDRCKSAGYNSLCLTVDTIVPGNREKDFRNGLTMPPKFSLASIVDFASKPKWVFNYITDKGTDLANLENVPSMKDTKAFVNYMGELLERNLTWDHAKEMVDYWQGPFAIKGIMSVADAIKAVEIGATTIILSNHGGRQLDAAPAPIEMLSEIRAAVGNDVEIVVDGGIRRGTDVLKAIALGANACSIGKAYVYGLASGGQAGVERALEILKAEILQNMALLGCTSLEQLTPDMIKTNG